jgi:sec-independent protein translocase protein TatA
MEVLMFEGLFQPMHLIVILFICLLIFGPSKLSELGKGLGDGIKNFKNAMNDDPAKQAAAQAAAQAAKNDTKPSA